MPRGRACAGSLHVGARGPADQTNRERYHVSGEAPEYLPAGLDRVTLLHSGRHTRGVHESAGRGFALTQHAHIVIIAVLYTRTTVALALPQAPSHTNVPHLSKGPPQPVPALRAPPQGCRIPILGRSVITYFRYADTYAGRPLSLPLSATSPTITQTTRYQILHPIPVPKSHHPGRLESCSPPSAVSHPLGRRPLTPPLDS